MSDTQDENIFADGFSFGSWFTSRVLPWIAIVFLGGVGSVVYGYWSLSMQVSNLKEQRCCGQVQENTTTNRELKRAISILVRLHTDNGDTTDGKLDDILNSWSHLDRARTTATAWAIRQNKRCVGRDTDRRGGYPYTLPIEWVAYRDDGQRKKRIKESTREGRS